MKPTTMDLIALVIGLMLFACFMDSLKSCKAGEYERIPDARSMGESNYTDGGNFANGETITGSDAMLTFPTNEDIIYNNEFSWSASNSESTHEPTRKETAQ